MAADPTSRMAPMARRFVPLESPQTGALRLIQAVGLETNAPRIGVLPTVLIIAGAIMWMLAYIWGGWIGFTEKTFTFPMIAIALNITWEFFFGFVEPPDPPFSWIRRLWFVLNLVILITALLYGRNFVDEKWILENFVLFWVALILLCYFGQVIAHRHFIANLILNDCNGVTVALLMNVAMSGLFVGFYHDRIDGYGGTGLSFVVGWFKLLGTGLVGLGSVLLFLAVRRCVLDVTIAPAAGAPCPPNGPDGGRVRLIDFLWFYMFLYAAILVLDVAYLWLLY